MRSVQTGGAAASGREGGYRHDRQYGSGYEIPVVIQLEWPHRLDIQYVLGAVFGTIIEIGIVLKWEADHAGQWVLCRLRQCFGVVLRERGSCHT